MTTNTITYSSELMKNYVQAEIMSPQAKFEALQTDGGLSLLFSMGTDNVFYVTQETHGSSTSGWDKTDLSSAQIAKDFRGKTGVACKTFDVNQNVSDGTVGLAMVINDGQNDHLYLCLGNSNADTTWLNQPAWVSYPFDNTGKRPAILSIVNVFLSETTDGQYIVADIIADPSSAEKLILRYYIDVQKTGGQAWCIHNITIDLEATGYSSCLGRQRGQTIDGLYTIGLVGSSPQFIIQPLYNIWNPSVPASPARLTLPGNLTPQAIASCRNSDKSTDLYVAANQGLYYFASANQKDQAQGVLLFQNSLLTGVTRLYAFSAGSKVIVWGLNQADQVFYMSCPIGRITTAGAWSCPVPILSGVDLISPYVNCVNYGNTFFAVGGSTLYKMIQSPGTSLWASQSITLPPPAMTTPAQSFSSYTTRIQLTDGNNQPVANTPLILSAASRGNFFINNLFYVLDTDPIPVNTDAMGSITIIEWVNSLQGTQLTVSEAGGAAVQINPMEKPFNKIAQLNSVSSLQNAVITNPDGSTQPLVAPGTSQSNLQTVAQANQNLATAYSHVSSPSFSRTLAAAMEQSRTSVLPGFPSAILTDLGDIYSWLKSGVENVITIVKDDATGLWNFVATIAGQAYRGLLDCVEKVVGAVEWVFKIIKTAIEDLLKYLSFLFEWGDISRTKQVMENLINLFIKEQISGIATLQKDFDAMIKTAQTAINNWAGITDWSGLGDAAAAPLSKNSKPASNSSPPTTLLSHHFQNNAANTTTLSPLPAPQPNQNPFNILLGALNQEDAVINATISQLKELAQELSNLSLGQVLEKLIAIFTDTVLDSAKVVIDALFDVIIEISAIAMEALNTKIYIPVVSDILKDFGVPSMSFLDLFCWIAAVPTTIIYKLAANAAPFPDNAMTAFLINATDFETVVQKLNPSQDQLAALGDVEPARKAAYVAGHIISGMMIGCASVLSFFEASQPAGLENNYSIPLGICVILSATSGYMANILDSQCPIKKIELAWINKATAALRLLTKVDFLMLRIPGSSLQEETDPAKGDNMKNLKAIDMRKIGAAIDNVLIIPAYVCTLWHFYELSQASSGVSKDCAILDETSSVTLYFGRICYTVTINTEPPTQTVFNILTSSFMFLTGGLKVVQGFDGLDS